MLKSLKALIAVGAVAATSALTAVAAVAVKKIIVSKTLDQAEELVNENESEEVEVSEEEAAEVRESMKAEAEELAENSRLVKGLRIASKVTGFVAIGGLVVAAIAGAEYGIQSLAIRTEVAQSELVRRSLATGEKLFVMLSDDESLCRIVDSAAIEQLKNAGYAFSVREVIFNA